MKKAVVNEVVPSVSINNGGITDEQIERWKQKYRKIAAVEVLDDETYVGYFHRPDMETYSMVAKLAKTDEIRASNILFDNCWLGGSSLLQEDAVLKMNAIGQLNAMTSAVSASLKNL